MGETSAHDKNYYARPLDALVGQGKNMKYVKVRKQFVTCCPFFTPLSGFPFHTSLDTEVACKDNL